MIAGRDINALGGNIVSTAGTDLAAGHNVNLLAATNTSEESHYKQVTSSGLLSSGGIGFTIGQVVLGKDFFAQIGCPYTDPQITDSYVIIIGCE